MAAHPFISDDPSTQSQGNHQLELNTDWLRDADNRSRIAAFTYTYGIQENTDVFFNIPAGIENPSGVANVSVGAKLRFYETEDTSLALKPELFLPTYNEDKGLRSGRASLALALLVSHEAGPWTFLGNIALDWNRYKDAAAIEENRSVLWRVSAGLSYRIVPQLAFVADTGVARNNNKASRINPAFLLGGLIYSPLKSLDLDVGLKTGLNRAELHRQFGAGITYRF